MSANATFIKIDCASKYPGIKGRFVLKYEYAKTIAGGMDEKVKVLIRVDEYPDDLKCFEYEHLLGKTYEVTVTVADLLKVAGHPKLLDVELPREYW